MPEDMRVVKVNWAAAADLPIQVANVFAVQHTLDGVILTIGQVAEPIFPGNPEEQQSARDQIQELPAHGLIRVLMTQERTMEMLNSIAQVMMLLIESGRASPAVVASFGEMSQEVAP